ncbi:transportin-like protein [Raphidocelis subcapitata]|uniref:Transportin-like protein n=1 Tax=Raphidocelis subcapitata TaxID=307507 RepID=A0A2V0NM34_9CHLO|nr:transportin-like protein [Raphidocelis subcapitata]|eukprot:GBF88521.1 transportin-like protein [Raphidocelis subcapitata]
MAAQVWAPNEAAVGQICKLLSDFQSPTADQAQVWQQLEAARHVPDFNNYLSFVFSKGESLPSEVRNAAGLLLKNNLKQQYATTTEDFRSYIKGDLLHVLSHPDRSLRHTAGSIVSTVAAAGGLRAWPELVMWLGHSLGSGEAATLDGALDALYKITEDSVDQINVKIEGPTWGTPQAVSSLLVPPLLALLPHPSAPARRGALAVLNLMLPSMPDGLVDNMEAFAQGLFSLATDGDSGVRKQVVAGMVGLLPIRPDLLMPQFHQVIEYMLAMHADGDEGVALESAEFWVAFCDADNVEPELLRPFLPRLIPLLLDKMVFEEFDEEVQEAEAEEEAAATGAADADKDVRPTHVGAGASRGGGGGEAEGDDEDGDDEPERRWNLRKCSAMGLDHISNVFNDEILPVLMPVVEARLADADWRKRESAILALGAVSEGCHMGLAPYLPQITSMLIPRLEDPRPMVRVISCWALGRYTQWVLLPPDAPEPPPGSRLPPLAPANVALFERALGSVLARVADRNRHVQQSACSALAVMEEHAGVATRGEVLRSQVPAILDTVAAALRVYSRRTLRALLDVLSTLAGVVGPALGEPAVAQRFMPQLFERWQHQGVAAPESAPIMEALTSLAVAFRDRFEPYAKPVFDAAVGVVGIMQEAKAAQAAGQPPPQGIKYEADTYMAAMDLLAGLADALRAGAEPLIAASRLVAALPEACRDEAVDVRQSGFALLGDVARACPSHLLPGLPQWVSLCLSQLDAPALTEAAMPAANNAAWALGELLLRSPPEAVAPHAERVSASLHYVLSGAVRVTHGLRENAAITLGRVAAQAPAALAPHAGHFLAPWLGSLRAVRDDVEKEDAFRGVVRLVPLNVEAGWAAFPQLAAAFASWRHIADASLRNDMAGLLHSFKQAYSSSGQWQQMEQRLEPALMARLRELYGM